ncbi:MAG: YmdB family metallophosphoesterase [Spirochaetaceae bacterium]|nr:MAG: YmdB family metallophosphoesterase [Spirochaetaceae bacterium]
MGIRVLYLGEVVGKAGIFCVKTDIKKLKEEYRADFTVANVDGATGGFGIGKNHSIYLRKLGIDVLTTGDQAYYKRDIVPHIDGAPYLLRPANMPPGVPGRGWRYYDVGGTRVVVLVLLGMSGLGRLHAGNPYTYLPELLRRIEAEAGTRNIILEFHATTTAEKGTMFYHADGKLTAVIGSGTRVQTTDATVMKGGTAVITDLGRVGSIDGVSGLESKIEIQQFLTGIPERSQDAWGRMELQGVVLELNEDGKASSIESFRRPCSVASPEQQATQLAEVPESDSAELAEPEVVEPETTE